VKSSSSGNLLVLHAVSENSPPDARYYAGQQTSLREPSKIYEETSDSIRRVNENYAGATHSPLRDKQISYVNSMSYDEQRFEIQGDSLNINTGPQNQRSNHYHQ